MDFGPIQKINPLNLFAVSVGFIICLGSADKVYLLLILLFILLVLAYFFGLQPTDMR